MFSYDFLTTPLAYMSCWSEWTSGGSCREVPSTEKRFSIACFIHASHIFLLKSFFFSSSALEHYKFLCEYHWEMERARARGKRRRKALCSQKTVKVHALIKMWKEILFLLLLRWQKLDGGEQIMNGTFSINYFTGSRDLPTAILAYHPLHLSGQR